MYVSFGNKLKFFDKFVIEGEKIVDKDPFYLVIDFRII
jgi:hypothetical protein